MITFAWHVTGMSAKPYPVLWLGDIPNEKHSPAAAMARQKHVITGDEEAQVWALGDAVSRVDFLAQKYPYIDKEPIDSDAKVTIVTEVTQIITTVVEEIEP